MAQLGGGGDFGHVGLKLFADLLADYRVGQRKFVFRPNHNYILVQGSLKDDIAVMLHISDDPVLFELSWNVTPRFSLRAGKLLLPFGTNEFHHIIGGRVDEQSLFLPETWGDFGVGLSHLLYDGEILSLEYAAVAVNGFEGTDRPLLGAGDAADNNLGKGLGLRLKAGLFGKLLVTASAYYDLWDAKDKYAVLFYSVGAELRPGLIDVPVLRRVRLRGEWARGEIQLPTANVQHGLLSRYAVGRGGYYAEALIPVSESVSFRARAGRVNPDNTVHDEGDLDVWEPAILIVSGKMTYTVAYQLVARVNRPYEPKDPPDVLYAKLYLQY